MKLSEIQIRVRQALDDVDESQFFYSEKDILDYIFNGLKDINNQLRFYTRFQFIVKEPYVDTYGLNGDFISYKTSADLKEGFLSSWSKFADIATKTNQSWENEPKFKINENTRKVYLNFVPSLGCTNAFDVVDNLTESPKNLIIFSSGQDLENYDYSPFVLWGENFYRITETESISYLGHTALKLFVSEVLPMGIDDVRQFSDNKLRFVDYVIAYSAVMNKEDYFFKPAGDIVVTANDTTVQTLYDPTLDNRIEVGDWLYCGFPQRQITGIFSDHFTIDKPFHTLLPSVPTQYQNLIIKGNKVVEVPNELEALIVAFAKKYAYIDSGDPERYNQIQLSQALLDEENRKQVSEQLNKISSESDFGYFIR